MRAAATKKLKQIVLEYLETHAHRYERPKGWKMRSTLFWTSVFIGIALTGSYVGYQVI